MSDPKFMMLLATIIQLNRAMQSAADNPMDAWRRQNVRHAMGLVPGAIRGLAGQFKENKFGNSDLPMVQKMLGGFVNVNAADGYKKFLENPDKRLIPKLGNIPASALAKAGAAAGDGNSEQLTFDDTASKNGGVGGSTGSDAAVGPQLSRELASLNDDGGANPTPASAAPTGPATSASLIFDDSTAKATDPSTDASAPSSAASSAPSSGNSASAAVTSSSSTAASSVMTGTSASSDFLTQANRDLAAIEVTVAPKATSALDEAFFSQKPTAQKQLDRPEAPAQTTPVTQYQMKMGPQFWNIVPLLKLTDLLEITPAHAEDEGGGQAANILFGLAAIMAGVAPMVAAAIQASADQNIAKTNAQAQIQMTNISAGTSKYLADQQTQVSMQQSQIAQQISADNQKATTDRLTFQLNALNQARQDANGFESKRLDYQQKLDQERLDIAKQQADQTVDLANQQFRLQESQTGNQVTAPRAFGGNGPTVAGNLGGQSGFGGGPMGPGGPGGPMGPGGGPMGPGGPGGPGLGPNFASANTQAGGFGGQGGGFAGRGGGGGFNPGGGNISGAVGGGIVGNANAGAVGLNNQAARGLASAGPGAGLPGNVGFSASAKLLSHVGSNTASADLLDFGTGAQGAASGQPGVTGSTTVSGGAPGRLHLARAQAPQMGTALRGVMNANLDARGSTTDLKDVHQTDLGRFVAQSATPSNNLSFAATSNLVPHQVRSAPEGAALPVATGHPGTNAPSLSNVYNPPSMGGIVAPGADGLTHSSRQLGSYGH